jgi:hypothetical protein
MAAKKAARRRTGSRREEAEQRLALFVEGINIEGPRGRDDLRELWRYACSRLSAWSAERLDVYGFSKQQLVMMGAQSAPMAAGKVPLDVLIEQKHRECPFVRLVVAFDAEPANQAIGIGAAKGASPQMPCLRLEKDFVLEHFAQSAMLPPFLKRAASVLLSNYGGNRGRPRASRRPPIADIELIYMAPMFEALVLEDVAALRAVFGLKKTPRDWPALPLENARPDFELRKIVDAHRKHGPTHLRTSYKQSKHAWAHEILKNADQASPIWRHPVAERIRKVLVGPLP